MLAITNSQGTEIRARVNGEWVNFPDIESAQASKKEGYFRVMDGEVIWFESHFDEEAISEYMEANLYEMDLFNAVELCVSVWAIGKKNNSTKLGSYWEHNAGCFCEANDVTLNEEGEELLYHMW